MMTSLGLMMKRHAGQRFQFLNPRTAVWIVPSNDACFLLSRLMEIKEYFRFAGQILI